MRGDKSKYNSGDKIGELLLTGKAIKGRNVFSVEYICVCGTVAWANIFSLKCGHTKSCGCLRRNGLAERATTHGYSKHSLYKTWSNIIERCLNPKATQYEDYGGKGVTVCEEWARDASAFIKWALDAGWKRGLTIERKKNEQGYNPSNCIVATWREQSRNKSTNHWLTAFGETKCITDWVADERCTVVLPTILGRIERGWGIVEAIATPPRPSKWDFIKKCIA